MWPLCQEVWSFDWRSLKNSALAWLGLVVVGVWPKRATLASLFGVLGPVRPLTDLAGLSGVGMSSRGRLSLLAVTPFGSTFEFTFLLISPIREGRTWKPPLLWVVDSRSFLFPSFSALFNLSFPIWGNSTTYEWENVLSPVSFRAKVLELEVSNDKVETNSCDGDKYE